MSEDDPDEPAIENQLQQARQALADAEGARDADLSEAVIVNRLYYACFHAAQAASRSKAADVVTTVGALREDIVDNAVLALGQEIGIPV